MYDRAEQVRAADGRAPDVFRPGAWVPMRCYSDDEEVDFAIVGTGAGGGTLACKLAEAGFSVVAFDAGPYWRPLEDFASDETEQNKLYWLSERISGGDDPVEFGSNNSGRAVGGPTATTGAREPSAGTAKYGGKGPTGCADAGGESAGAAGKSRAYNGSGDPAANQYPHGAGRRSNQRGCRAGRAVQDHEKCKSGNGSGDGKGRVGPSGEWTGVAGFLSARRRKEAET